MARSRLKRVSMALAGPLLEGNSRSREGRLGATSGRLRPRPFDGEDELARRELEQRVAAYLPGRALALSLTDNRHTMITVKREQGAYELRLHHMFLGAEPEVVRALGRYVGENDRASSHLLGRYIDGHQSRIRTLRRRQPRTAILRTQGEVHDLRAIFDALNIAYFARSIDAQITWGPRVAATQRRRNSIKMGSYSVEDRLIRIHLALDRLFVPRFFVEWIVFHEMLHQKHDIPVIAGRRQFHTRAFVEEEATFLHYEAARCFERANIDRILS